MDFFQEMTMSKGITIIVCLCIIIIFFVYGANIWRIYKFVKDVPKKKTMLSLFQTGIFKERFNDYEKTMTIPVDKGNKYKTHNNASDFFNLNYVLHTLKVNPRALAGAPGILTGFGVLGTFIGLAYSVHGFNFESTPAIINSIKELMGGMGTAFYTSIFGMLASLLFIALDKTWTNILSRIIDQSNEQLDKDYLITQTELIQIENERHENEMKKLFTVKETEEGEEIPLAQLIMNTNSNLSFGMKDNANRMQEFAESFKNVLAKQFDLLTKLATSDNIVGIQNLIQGLITQSLNNHSERLSVLNGLMTLDKASELQNVLAQSIAVIATNQANTNSKLDGISSIAANQETLLIKQNEITSEQNQILSAQSEILDNQKSIASEINSVSVKQETLLGQQMEIIQEHKSATERQNSLLREQKDKIESLLTFYDDNEDDTISVGNAIRNLLENSNSQTQSLQSFTTDLSSTLNSSLGTTMSNSIEDTLMPLLNSLEEDQKALLEKFDVMNKTIESPTSEMMSGLKDDLKGTLEGIFNEFKNAISDKAHGQLDELATKLAATGDSLNGVPQNVETMMGGVSAAMDKMVQMVEKMREETISSTTDNTRRMQEQITAATTALANAISDVRDIMSKLMLQQVADSEAMRNSLKTDMSDINSSIKTNMEGIMTSLHGTVASIKDQQEEMSLNMSVMQESMLELVNKTVKEMSSNVTDSMGNMTNKFGESVNKIAGQSEEAVANMLLSMNGQMTTMTQSLQTTVDAINSQQSNMMSTSQAVNDEIMNNLAGKIDLISTAVSKTVTDMTDYAETVNESITVKMQTEFDKMTNALSNTVKSINTQQKDLIDYNQKTIVGLKNTLETMKNSTGQLLNASNSMSTVVAKIQNAVLDLNTTARNTKEVAEKLTSSSDKLSRVQQDFITRAENVNDRIQETTENLTELVKKSSSMSSEYAKEFSVIESALKNIFGQIQTGLTQYSSTVKQSTGDILASYSTTMTKALQSLEGVVQNLGDLVEELVDSVDKIKK